MSFRSRDFKSVSATITTPRQALEAGVGIAPTYTSFAEKRLSYLATRPLAILKY